MTVSTVSTRRGRIYSAVGVRQINHAFSLWNRRTKNVEIIDDISLKAPTTISRAQIEYGAF